MNEKFFSLPEEKQQAIINAGFRVFSQNTYKKSPVSEIAAEAGISKSLLFYYFRNKKELYLFLWEKCAQVTIEYMREYGCYDKKDLFEMMYSGMQVKIRIMKQYPDMGVFVIKAFYEKDPEVCGEIQKSYQQLKGLSASATLAGLDPGQFAEGLDLRMMYREMYLASEGYVWEMVSSGKIDADKMEKEFTEIIGFWKSIFLRKGQVSEGSADGE
ncbi:MAG: TetR/AcrR family transcriptional regulator [Anaerovoracaceae bacterium]